MTTFKLFFCSTKYDFVTTSEKSIDKIAKEFVGLEFCFPLEEAANDFDTEDANVYQPVLQVAEMQSVSDIELASLELIQLTLRPNNEPGYYAYDSKLKCVLGFINATTPRIIKGSIGDFVDEAKTNQVLHGFPVVKCGDEYRLLSDLYKFHKQKVA